MIMYGDLNYTTEEINNRLSKVKDTDLTLNEKSQNPVSNSAVTKKLRTLENVEESSTGIPPTDPNVKIWIDHSVSDSGEMNPEPPVLGDTYDLIDSSDAVIKNRWADVNGEIVEGVFTNCTNPIAIEYDDSIVLPYVFSKSDQAQWFGVGALYHDETFVTALTAANLGVPLAPEKFTEFGKKVKISDIKGVNPSVNKIILNEWTDSGIPFKVRIYGKTHTEFTDEGDIKPTAPLLTWESLGTSITWYNDNVTESFTKGYQTRVMEVINFKNFINKGQGGVCMGGNLGLGANVDGVVSAADIYTIEHGINDWGNRIPVGTMDDYKSNTGTNTFFGAYRKVIDKIYTLNPLAKIILCTPRKAYGFEGFLPQHWYDPKEGVYLSDYADAVKQIAEFMSFPICDWFAESQANQENLARLSIDAALHPNDEGYNDMSKLLIQTLKKVI